MITNSKLTVYHKRFDNDRKIEVWQRFNYDKIWWFGGKGSNTNRGYENANDVQIRIPYDENDVDILNFKIGDILVKGELDFDIETQQNLAGFEVYNITSINDNNFGSTPHLHLSGK